MKRRFILPLDLICRATVLSWLLAVAAGTGANPYQPIIERNVFGLKPPVQAPDPTAEPPVKPVKVQLIGLANMFGKKTAIIKFLEPPKPGQPIPQEPLVLSEGEAAQDIEVIAIDEKAGLAKILNKGTPVTLDIKDYTATLPGSSGGPPQLAGGPGAPPTGPRMAAMPQRQPGLLYPGTVVQPQPVRPTPPAATSSGQSGSNPQVQSGGVSAAQEQPGTGGGLVLSTGPSIPQRPIRTPEPPQIPYEEQVLLIELERERTRELFLRGQYPPLPPTELTPDEDLKLILAPPPEPPGP